ncbi:hypothetical protein [Brumimicrobium oceani]|uniref:hypothetical protein n=1 Tax=Brumimicrobium oceani TaxID=2100725 RepID=UPI001304A023|nr:hypothetical protein [Brumimicrobium oceani]
MLRIEALTNYYSSSEEKSNPEDTMSGRFENDQLHCRFNFKCLSNTLPVNISNQVCD